MTPRYILLRIAGKIGHCELLFSKLSGVGTFLASLNGLSKSTQPWPFNWFMLHLYIVNRGCGVPAVLLFEKVISSCMDVHVHVYTST